MAEAKSPKSSKAASGAKKKTLVIVESPAKAKTIERYLGSSYMVRASMGHLIDLPKSRIAIDVENGFEPEYITVRGRTKILRDLEKEAKKAKAVLLASDNDREGEAIAWHLRNYFSQKADIKAGRIVFNEITPQVIKDAVKSPREIDEAKVDAQKARRVLDRLVGYNLSPLLWKKVKNGVSAGRVQSVALRLICEREAEVEKFVPEEFWTLKAALKKGASNFFAELALVDGKAASLKSKADADFLANSLKSAEFRVKSVKESEKEVKPKPPLTTSKLQQLAATRLGFTSKKTMQVAQQLYEGVSISGHHVGLITYMRTDSTRLSPVAVEEARKFIGEKFPDCLPEKPIFYSAKKDAQDAHEAIRPTYVSYSPETVEKFLSREQFKLYSLVWESFVACQMKSAKSRTVSAEISAKNAVFRASSTKIVEKGFLSALKVLAAKDEKSAAIPSLKEGDVLALRDLSCERHLTQGPSRFSDASIVKALEEKGIGRPSTYAPIISVLLDRFYVSRSNKQLVPTVLGKKINEILVRYFPDVINENWTAQIEAKLDEVESKDSKWSAPLEEFYPAFKQKLDGLMATLESVKGRLDEETGEKCEKCGRPMLKKLGRFGYFLACSGFPECRNAKPIPVCRCPRCGGDVVKKKAKGRGREFYGCSNYPECDFLSYFKPTNTPCPKCGQLLVEKFSKKDGAFKACINPNCDYLHAEEGE